MKLGTISRRRMAGAMVLASLALAACGSDDSDSGDKEPAKPAAKKTLSPAASQRALVDAAEDYNSAYSRFKMRIREDAQANDLTAAQGDASQFRTAVFDYDAAIRKIKFPASQTGKVNSLLGKSRTVIADLDSISQAASIASYNRLVNRLALDNRELIDANNDLNRVLG